MQRMDFVKKLFENGQQTRVDAHNAVVHVPLQATIYVSIFHYANEDYFVHGRQLCVTLVDEDVCLFI